MGDLGHGIGGRRRVLFVAGVSRSGSTALDFILGNRRGGFSLGEIYAWYRPFRDHHIAPRCACGRRWDDCPVWQQVGHPKARHLHRTVSDALDVTTVVDSSKDLAWIRDAYRWAAADDIEPHVVLSWREPRGLAHSYWKRGDLGPSGGWRRARTTGHIEKPPWLRNLERYVRQLDDLGFDYHVVAFDELIADPTTQLEKLHFALDMEPSPGQERFWEGDYHSMFGSGGTRDQLRAQSMKLERPELPPAFLEYWDGLPAEWRQEVEELNSRVFRRRRVSAPPRRLPPWWYAKSRAIRYRQHLSVRWRRATGRSRGPAGSLPPSKREL